MKTLLLCRHAKSDWSNLYQADYDRSLNERGLHDAPMMGQRLAARGFHPDLMVASTAQRAAQTATLLSGPLGYPAADIQWEKPLYHAPPRVIRDLIFSIPNSVQHLLVVCHNPGITDFVNSLCGHITDNLPTCGMAAFYIDTERWEDYPQAKVSLYFYDFPKNGI